MTALQLLLVEDEDTFVSQYQDVLRDYIKQHGRNINMRVCRTLAEAKSSLDATIDAAIVDLNLGKDTTDGGELIDEIEEHFRVPVAVLTGTPDDADDKPPVIGVFTKGEHGFADVLDCLWDPYMIGLTRIMGGRGLLEERLNRVFLKNLLPTLDAWIGYGRADAERTEKALLRYALGHLVADLDGDETPSYPEEVYLAPPLDNSLTTGSLVKRTDDETCHVVMTPACDLVVRKDGKPKADSIILAEVVPEETVYDSLKANAGQKRNLKQNNDKLCFHWLPNSKVVYGGYLDFRRLQTVPVNMNGTNYTLLDVRIAPGYIKDIVSRFSAYYARQGQPVIEEPPSATRAH